jgi:hypothetical protein
MDALEQQVWAAAFALGVRDGQRAQNTVADVVRNAARDADEAVFSARRAVGWDVSIFAPRRSPSRLRRFLSWMRGGSVG